jgi:hypothetical protein
MQGPDGSVEFATVIWTDCKIDLVIKTQDVYHTVIHTDIIVNTKYHNDFRTNVVYQTAQIYPAAVIPEVECPTQTAVYSAAASNIQHSTTHMQQPQETHVQSIQPVQTHSQAGPKASSKVHPVETPTTVIQAYNQTYAHNPAQNHDQAPETHVQTPSQTQPL